MDFDFFGGSRMQSFLFRIVQCAMWDASDTAILIAALSSCLRPRIEFLKENPCHPNRELITFQSHKMRLADIGDHFKLLWDLIDAILDKQLQDMALVTNAIGAIDRNHGWKVSGLFEDRNKMARLDYNRHESDKVRII